MYFKIRYVLPDCFKAAELHCNRYDYVLTNWIRALSAHTIISYYSQSKTGFVVISNSSVGHREMVQHNFRNFHSQKCTNPFYWAQRLAARKRTIIQSSHRINNTAKRNFGAFSSWRLTSHIWRPQERNQKVRKSTVNSRSTITHCVL